MNLANGCRVLVEWVGGFHFLCLRGVDTSSRGLVDGHTTQFREVPQARNLPPIRPDPKAPGLTQPYRVIYLAHGLLLDGCEPQPLEISRVHIPSFSVLGTMGESCDAGGGRQLARDRAGTISTTVSANLKGLSSYYPLQAPISSASAGPPTTARTSPRTLHAFHTSTAASLAFAPPPRKIYNQPRVAEENPSNL